MAEDLIHQGARLLARWLALEVALSNEEQIQKGLQEGNLPARLGVVVLEAYGRYRESLPEDVVSTTDYFKEALNGIVGGGRKVF
ncbi:MAG: hypothetical protein MUE60_09210 [Candidatus Eisenbacteria bacterium]|jgi:hypothetical protein|nr:hypothetical protein [Candidatus Eisenbacteria bacterium]